MDTIVVASSIQDAQAVEAVMAHHAKLSGALALQVEALINAAARADRAGADLATTALVRWCEDELVPHALAEEESMYPKAHENPSARLLVDAMVAEHREIVALIESLRVATNPVRAAATAQALMTLFKSHLVKENDQILPLLAASTEVSLAEILDGMHELLGEKSEGGCGGDCTCNEENTLGELPELDARLVPHAIRHATIFGALDSITSGGGLVLLAPHDPLPLLKQVESRTPGRFTVDYLESGPDTWRLQFVRN